MNRDEKFKKDMERQAATKRDHMKSMAMIAREVYKLIKIRDSVKSTICKATTILEEIKDNDEVQVFLEAAGCGYDSLKIMLETEHKVEMKLAKHRKMRGTAIEMLKEIDKQTIQMRRNHLEIKRNTLHIMKLERRTLELKREVRQEQIMSEIKNDPLLKVVEDECIEILKSRLNVD